jgi:hypothetical protein
MNSRETVPDFHRALLMIRGRGTPKRCWTYRPIAARIGVAEGTLRNIASRCPSWTPSWPVGERLLALFREVVGCGVPRRPWMPQPPDGSPSASPMPLASPF